MKPIMKPCPFCEGSHPLVSSDEGRCARVHNVERALAGLAVGSYVYVDHMRVFYAKNMLIADVSIGDGETKSFHVSVKAKRVKEESPKKIAAYLLASAVSQARAEASSLIAWADKQRAEDAQ